ncbi:MAG: hypothetical protein ACREOF_01745 [Gemmatimonadales bacterium]
MRQSIWGLLIFAALTGCYQYRYAGPVESVEPVSGRRIALRLTDQGAADLALQLGGSVASIEGEIVGADADQLELAVASTEDNRRVTSDWKGERVSIPRHAVASVRERRFSPGATGLAGALFFGGIAGAYALFGGEGSVLEGEGPSNGPSPGNQ